MKIVTKKIDNTLIFYDKDIEINIEELFRAKRQPPTEELILKWANGRKIDQHLSLIVTYSGKIHGHDFSKKLINEILLIDIPSKDSILTRIKEKLAEN